IHCGRCRSRQHTTSSQHDPPKSLQQLAPRPRRTWTPAENSLAYLSLADTSDPPATIDWAQVQSEMRSTFQGSAVHAEVGILHVKFEYPPVVLYHRTTGGYCMSNSSILPLFCTTVILGRPNKL